MPKMSKKTKTEEQKKSKLSVFGKFAMESGTYLVGRKQSGKGCLWHYARYKYDEAILHGMAGIMDLGIMMDLVPERSPKRKFNRTMPIL